MCGRYENRVIDQETMRKKIFYSQKFYSCFDNGNTSAVTRKDEPINRQCLYQFLSSVSSNIAQILLEYLVSKSAWNQYLLQLFIPLDK